MANRIRTLNFLPEIFQTPTNTQFLNATLDQLVNQPNTEKIQGYVGSKFGPGIDAKSYYVTEPTKTREDYQLDPGVVFKKTNEQVAQDFISYPGIIDSLKLEGGVTEDNNRLFEGQFYAWDSFTNLDKLINYNQYYWIPNGPERVIVSNADVNEFQDYVVKNDPSYYEISVLGTDNYEANPTITLLRGGTYTFTVNQDSQFWIQGLPGVNGTDPNNPNSSVRDIYGVTNNGASKGVVTFEVPFRNAQNQYLLPGDNTVDLVSDIPFFQLNGAPVSTFPGIDGVAAIEGLRVIFYNTGYPLEVAYASDFYSETPYDTNNAEAPIKTITITASSSSTNELTCDSTQDLLLGNQITFSGIPFGNINQYVDLPNTPINSNDLTVGQIYYINQVGDTDWISIGLNSTCEFIGSLENEVLFVSSVLSGSLQVGFTISGEAIISNTKIVEKIDIVSITGEINGGLGGEGIPVEGVVLTVQEVNSGVLAVGTEIIGVGVAAGTYITGYVTGTGGTGTYIVNNSQLVNNGPLAGVAPSGTTMYRIDISQTVSSATYSAYEIVEGKLFTAIGAVSGTGDAIPYTPVNYYVSSIVDSTKFTVSTQIQNFVKSSQLEIGKKYIIKFVGTTDFTLVGAASNTVGTTFTATTATIGTGSAVEVIDAGNFEFGLEYTIQTIGTTDFTLIGAASNTVGISFIATGSGTGTGTAILGSDVVLTTDTGSMVGYINQSLYEEGYYTQVNQNFYKITFSGTGSNRVINLVPDGFIPINEKITAKYGTVYINKSFYKNTLGFILEVPYISSILDTLYYQDSVSPDKVGTIKLIESNEINSINVDRDIVGHINYTATNGVVFTNGLKVSFQGNIYPEKYKQNDYYIEGVGTAIELIPVTDLVTPEPFTSSILDPYDVLNYSMTEYEGNSYVPVYADYITIARNSVNKNAWSRSNRWFHIGVIQATASYNNDPDLLNVYATENNKAKRPIIEFYPNLKLFESGATGKSPIDFIDFRSTDAFSNVAGQINYYPDVQTFTYNTATINGTTTNSTTITVNKNDIFVLDPVTNLPVVGSFELNQYITDSQNLLPTNSYISDIVENLGMVTLTISWQFNETIITTSNISLSAVPSSVNNFGVFDGARIVFANDLDKNVRNKIYVVRFSQVQNNTIPVITLTEADDGLVLSDQQTVAFRGFNFQGYDFYYNGTDWLKAQQKNNINQPPLFDVYDKNGISFGDKTIYGGSSFEGCKLFAYGIGSGINDPILNFPLRYSSVENVGDISFDVSINLDTFNYVIGTTPITENVNSGYVYNYNITDTYNRLIGWQTAVSPSVQYQLFSFNFDPLVDTGVFTCDIAANLSTNWPVVLVYNNNNFIQKNYYTIDIGDTTTTVTLNVLPVEKTVIQIKILSTQVSNTAYYDIPINLNNNPLNADIETVNVGELRLQYQSIFYNNPNLSGEMFGNNNFRDLGNLVPWANQIIQNSASLVLPGIFLRKQEHNLFNALTFNSREYIKFKTLLIDTANNIIMDQTYAPSIMLDECLEFIGSTKTNTQPFFYSDMLPNKSAYITNAYRFANFLDTSVFQLSQTYNFKTANYNGVLVYLTRVVSGTTITHQLIRNIDYIVSEDAPSLTVTTDLIPNDIITIKEYNQTYGSYVPNTPTKLGLYPAYIPEVVLDIDYAEPTYFIKGHDGSYNKLYGNYDPVLNTLVDFRDQILLEFELRIYNNLKLSNLIPIQEFEIGPGFFRQSKYSLEEFLRIYEPFFLDWVGLNRVDYKTQIYNKNNFYTYNYFESGNRINNQPIFQGYWRGIYKYFYDTYNPNTAPWEMIGYNEQPSWWETRYGPAPYTSDNTILWNDLAQGIDYNNGNPIVIGWAIRPELLQVLPVDSAGNLVNPFVSIVGNYIETTFQRDWKVGDIAPTELSYRRSSSYPFDLMKIFALTQPAKFYNYGVDIDRYQYNVEFNQFLFDDRKHLVLEDIQVYGSGTPVTSYVNWIVDYEKQIGIDATANITTLLNNVDVRLVHRLAGFSDKTLLKFFIEKGTPNNRNASLLIPDESYQILLYDNQPFDKIVYSGLVVQLTENFGYTINGNSQTSTLFKVLEPLNDGYNIEIKIEDLSVKIPKNYSTEIKYVPYGTSFYSPQELCSFIAAYGAYLTSQGMLFNITENNVEVNWNQMIAEVLYFIQSGWEVNSVVTLSPAAKKLTISRDGYIVQPLTISQNNFVLNDNLYPIQLQDLNILRDNTEFNVLPLNTGDSISYGQFHISNMEHGLVFDNQTLFNDTIYNLTTGLRQFRILVTGSKSAEWDGTITASGFILNQDNIKEWNREVKYTKGSIVLYKNNYYTALKIVQPGNNFNELDWKKTNYDSLQTGLLPNPSTRAYESTVYYDVNNANLENDGDLLGFSLIGYRPRRYMTLADLSDITQVNVYRNLIKEKGTRAAANVFNNATLPQGGIKYDIYENWAIKSSEFGGVLNSNFVQLILNEQDLNGNPAILGIVQGDVYDKNLQQFVPLNSIYNYNTPIDNPNILTTIPPETPNSVFPDAGYVNFDDVKMSSYFYNNLPNAVNQKGVVVPLDQLYVRDYFWLANYLEKWQVMTPASLGEIVLAKNNLNNTVTVVFSNAHNLTQYQPFAIINLSPDINGYYVATLIVDAFTVIINATLNPDIKTITGLGIGLLFQSQRVDTPSDIINLPLLDSEFIKNKVWVDTNTDGSWAVYRKSIDYQHNYEFFNPVESVNDDKLSFGSSVAYSTNFGYLIGDSNNGVVYRYDPITNELIQTITNNESFGTKIVYGTNIVVITEPKQSNIYIYQLVKNNINDSLQSSVSLLQTIKTNCDSVCISEDTNYIYVGDITNVQFKAYHKSTTSVVAGNLVQGQVYTIESIGTTNFKLAGSPDNKVGTTFVATGPGTGSGTASSVTYSLVNTVKNTNLFKRDSFGYSITTNYDGSLIVVGAPDQDFTTSLVNVLNWGYAYVYNRLVQNLEAQYTNVANTQPQVFALAWTPVSVPSLTGSDVSSNFITSSGTMENFALDTPVIFTGINNTFDDFKDTGLKPNTVYYIENINGSTFTVKKNLTDSAPLDLVNNTGLSFNIFVQQNVLDVSLNGTIVSSSQYAVIGNNFVYVGALKAGDIVTVSGTYIAYAQQLKSENAPQIGENFGKSLDVNLHGNEVVIGAPYEISENIIEGKVYRFTSGGGSYGTIIGIAPCNITAPRNLLINGYLITLTAGNATDVANLINRNRILNVEASSFDGKLILTLVDQNIGVPNQKLVLTSNDATTFAELGIDLYTLTQEIYCPHKVGPTEFGYCIKFNEYNSFIVGAPVGTRYAATTFDFSDDELDNDTVFDQNATQFIDYFLNAGAAYIFDYLGQYHESLDNPGKYVYAQSVNSRTLEFGPQPYYGSSVDFNQGGVIVGAPNYFVNDIAGQAVTFVNVSGNIQNWSVFRSSSAVVDINTVYNVQIFELSTNNTLINLDYIDPLQGKILGVARENIDFVSNVDPARYNVIADNLSTSGWGADYVGKVWFDTSNVRFVNYHQNDLLYNSKYWGSVFPGSDVAVYSWIASPSLPSVYQGPGVPLNESNFATHYIVNNAGNLTPMYYFWVRNTNIVFSQIGKTLSDTIIASYIANPINSGVSYLVPLLPNSFGIYNSSEYINNLNSVLSLSFSTGVNDVTHNQYDLIRENYQDDFLPGLPTVKSANKEPISLYAKYLDSLSGTDIYGNIVPDPFLSKALQTGILNRPKQSFFLDRLKALQNLVQYTNEVLMTYPFGLSLSASFLFTKGEFYDTQQYWEYANWWAPGYSNATKSALQVPIYADLATLTVKDGTIVTVQSNGSRGLSEIYIYNATTGWELIGVNGGTIQLKTSLYDYANTNVGFGNNFYDTTVYDFYPSEETRYILRALNEQLPEEFSGEFLPYRNKSLILMFEYIQTEALENQNYLTWLNKTSLLDVSHTVRELLPYQLFKSDNQEFLAGYIDEVKPYHVFIKDFLFKFTGVDTLTGPITDFDLPAAYNTTYDKFISPQLVYTSVTSDYQYLPSSTIWENDEYKEWYNNYGLNLGGQQEYNVCSLTTYMSLSTKSFFVDNSAGLPSIGILTIGKEQILYTNVDRTLNFISGVTRGYNNSQLENHIPGEFCYIDLPGVVLLNQGRAYAAPPRVVAYTDPLLYPLPRRSAILEPVMANDRVININVVDPGDGYLATPTILIDPAISTTFDSSNVDTEYNIIRLFSSTLQTGDIVQYKVGATSTGINGLTNNQWYFINVLDSYPLIVVALYTTQENALYDRNRVKLLSQGTGSHSLNQGARAIAIPNSMPIRENIITLRYDRTSYRPNIIDWQPGSYYGAYYAGRYSNALTVASSSIKLESTQPPIDSILASAEGVYFAIQNVSNKEIINYSSFIRSISMTISTNNAIRIVPQVLSFDGTGSISGNILTITSVASGQLQKNTFIYNVYDANTNGILVSPSTQILNQLTGTTGGIGTYTISESYPNLGDLSIKGFEENTPGTTQGFTQGMPVVFQGSVGNSGLLSNITYYVSSVLNNLEFTVCFGQFGPYIPINLNDYKFTTNASLTLIVGQVTNVAVLDLIYPGISTVTRTTKNSNSITLPLNVNGTGGTTNFYIGLPLFFTGNVFGNVKENVTYYVNGIIDNQNFTISLENNAYINNIVETSSFDDTITLDVLNDNYSINEPVIFSTFVVKAGDFVIGQEYVIKEVKDTDFTAIGASENYKGVKFTATGQGSGSGSAYTETFGNIIAGETYYVVSFVGTLQIQIGLKINDTPITLIDSVGTGEIISQKNAVQLVDATGSMTVNINLPVSPGQINGQLLNFYNTSDQIIDQSGVNTGLITKTITATLAGTSQVNRITFSASQVGSTDTLYINMPITFASNVIGAKFVGSISGTTLTVSSMYSGFITTTNTLIAGGTITANTRIISQASGNSGEIGTYDVDTSQTEASTTITSYTLNNFETYYITDFGTTTVDCNKTTTGVFGASFIADINGPVMTVTDVSSGYVNVGATLFGNDVLTSATVIDQISGTPGKTGNYLLSINYNCVFEGYIFGTTLTVVNMISGSINTGLTLNANGIASSTTVDAQLTGTTGGAGTYTVNNSQTLGSVSNLVTFVTITSLTDAGLQTIISVIETLQNNDTDKLYVGMPIIFSGNGISNVVMNNQYYVSNIVNGKQFAISASLNGELINLVNDTGLMTLTGDPWITVSETMGGSNVDLTYQTLTNTFTQIPLTTPVFDVSYIMGGYRVIITNTGTGFAVNNKIVITGDNLGGTTPANDLELIVNDINVIGYSSSGNLISTGEILSVICNGTVPNSDTQYYLKVISPNQVEVYSDKLFEVPVSGINFPFYGVTQTTVYKLSSSTVYVSDVSGFNLYDSIVFTGEVVGNIIAGRKYFIKTINTSLNTLTISTDPDGTTFTVGSADFIDFTMATSGDYAVLPEPFYFNQSLVKYNNQVWLCLVSNNDDKFILGKWELLKSSDRRLNALDRIIAYYNPTDDMPGVDLPQLLTGISYPNNIYKGNLFQPNQQYPIDTQLLATDFFPTKLTLSSLTARKSSGLISTINSESFSGVGLSNNITSTDQTYNWYIIKLADIDLQLTDIIKTSNNYYFVTTKNLPNTILKGSSTLSLETDLKFKSIFAPSTYLNSIVESDYGLVAVGSNIVNSVNNGETWNVLNNLSFDQNFVFDLKSVSYVESDNFTGHISVGFGEKVVKENNEQDYRSLIVVTKDLISFTPINIDYQQYNGIAYNSDTIVIVGTNGTIYYSNNGYDYIGVTETNLYNTFIFDNSIEVLNNTIFQIGDLVQFSGMLSNTIKSKVTSLNGSEITVEDINKFYQTQTVIFTGNVQGNLTIGKTYYINTVNNTTSTITISEILLGPTVVVGSFVTTDFVISNVTLMENTNYYVSSISVTNNTISLCYDQAFTSPVTLGNSSAVINSYLYKVNQTLNNVQYISDLGYFIAVGNNGHITKSTDGLNWTNVVVLGLTDNLYGITYNNSIVTITGDDNTVVSTTDLTNFVLSETTFTRPEQVYNIQGADFEFGYGPEELVPGIVSDNITIIVNTRPGTNWPVTIYEHVGYKVVSVEIPAEVPNRTVYSFAGVAQVSTYIRVAVITPDTNPYCLYEQSIYEGIDYTIDWINKLVILNTSLNVNQKLRIDVYEAGNGDQLVKSNTDVDPIRYNENTEWYEIYLDCNYSATIFAGGGVIRFGTGPIEAVAVRTQAVSNIITLTTVKNLTINDPIKFEGVVFGNIEEDVTYYVKTISLSSNAITVSKFFNVETQTAGITYELSTASGTMVAIVQIGTGSVYTEPLVTLNGSQLIRGLTGTVVKTTASRNTITCNSTIGMLTGNRISFTSTIFGGIIQGGEINVTDIIVGNSYRINVIGTTDFTAIGASQNVRGEIFVATDVGTGTGVVTPVYYVDRVYDNNEFIISNTLPIFTTIYGALDNTDLFFPDSIICNDTTNFNVDDPVIFSDISITGTPSNSFGTIVTGQVYYVYSILDGTHFTVSLTQGGSQLSLAAVATAVNTSGLVTDQINVVQLTDATGGASFITSDFAFGIQPNGTQASLIFAYGIDNTQDYITYTILGETEPAQYGYTIPEVQVIISDGTDTYPMTNYNGGSNPENAIVEINGYRVDPALYTIDDNNNQIVFDTAPAVDDVIALTTYNLTDRQYFLTNKFENKTVSPITQVINQINLPIAYGIATATTAPDIVTLGFGTDTSKFVVGQFIQFYDTTGIGIGGIDTANGTVYTITDIVDANDFKIDAVLTNDTGGISCVVGGNQTTRIYTETVHNLQTNDLVRLDGLNGSIELNNNLYYVHVITDSIIDLYQYDSNNPNQKYSPVQYEPNYPITNVSNYTGGGFVWKDGSFVTYTTIVTDTDSMTNQITITQLNDLTVGAPVVFMQDNIPAGQPIIGGIIAGQTYFVSEIFTGGPSFTITEVRDGPVFELSTDSGTATVCQFVQDNTDRLWVTVNGERVPTTSLRINLGNDISILDNVTDTDVVIITSMMPNSTPDNSTYFVNVNQTNTPTVYRANYSSRTYLTQDLYNTSSEIYVNDVRHLVNILTDNQTAPSQVDGKYYIGINGTRNLISGIIVSNITRNLVIDPSYYTLEVISLTPTIIIDAPSSVIQAGDTLEITVIEGNLIYISGEQIRFNNVDLENNKLYNLERGVNGTGTQVVIPKYTDILSYLPQNELDPNQYNITWNPIPGTYNILEGDPLQIATTQDAYFFRPTPTRNQFSTSE